MRRIATALLGWLVATCALVTPASPAHAARPAWACANPDAIGIARLADIDAAKGHVYGSVTSQPHESILKPKEVVLTFDDGPYPGVTERILEVLDEHCTKATFFVVGQMAQSHAGLLRETIARGHTIGTHTWSHPLGVRRHPTDYVIGEIDHGFMAASKAARGQIAPFFRFPGLGDSAETVAYLRSRGIATFSVDVISNDSFIRDPMKLVERTLNILAEKGSGILLFHDIKLSAAEALPLLLTALKRQGYKVVHLRSRQAFKPWRPAPLIAPRPLEAPGVVANVSVPRPVPYPMLAHERAMAAAAAASGGEPRIGVTRLQGWGAALPPDYGPSIRAAFAAHLGMSVPTHDPTPPPRGPLTEPWMRASLAPFVVLEPDEVVASHWAVRQRSEPSH